MNRIVSQEEEKSILVDPATDTIVHFVIRGTQDEQAGLFASPI